MALTIGTGGAGSSVNDSEGGDPDIVFSTSGNRNAALAFGNGANAAVNLAAAAGLTNATASGNLNNALSFGNSLAFVNSADPDAFTVPTVGNLNAAWAIAEASRAFSGDGDFNVALARGDSATATASGGNGIVDIAPPLFGP